MKRRPQSPDRKAITLPKYGFDAKATLGLVMSGGGSRAAYQVGALKALEPYFSQSSHQIGVIVGSSIGSINGLLLGAGIKHGYTAAVDELESLWMERTFRNTFAGHPSRAFFRSIKIAVLQYLQPGPSPSATSIFDPTPLMNRVDEAIKKFGGLEPKNRAEFVKAVAVMTTVEGKERKPLLVASTTQPIPEDIIQGATFQVAYVEALSAKHGFASAALPSILPPVEIDTEHGKVHLVDGGISQNVPVDPAGRLGAERVVVIDISGRDWWLNRAGEAHDTRPTWEVPAAEKTFCFRPPDTFVIRCQKPLGPLLKAAVGRSTSKFLAAAGATWPIFSLLKKKLGEEVAFEVMAYVALDPDYAAALIERGFNETVTILKNKSELEFSKAQALVTSDH